LEVSTLTQQELVDRLNQLTLHYNLTWFDIKYDADKAIDKINSYMGTIYPKMSDVLSSPTSTYSIPVGGVNHPYFPEHYLHSVVIPYVAMEILARDEEFTTIYNKYMTELEDGLFNMFQREFNKVPLAFRQQPDQGVFFASESALGRIARNNLADLPVFKFKVNYNVNNADIVLNTAFVKDEKAYLYNEVATILDWNIDVLSYDGTKVYHFLGWGRNRNEVTVSPIQAGATMIMTADVNLYAQWEVINTLTITPAGEVALKDLYMGSLTYLIIPDTISGIPVRSIKSNFLMNLSGGGHAINIQTIILPHFLTHIRSNAFNGFQGEHIILPETLISSTYPGITIEINAFTATPSLTNITIPLNVTHIAAGAFPVVNHKHLTIRCRRFQTPTPDGWINGWYAASGGTNYTVEVVWGYNV
jgi:hypothetical protein